MKRLILLAAILLLTSSVGFAQVSSSRARRVQTPASDPSSCPAGTVWVRAGVFKICLTNGVVTSMPSAATVLTDSASLRSALSDETGSGAAVFANSPALVTPTGIVKGDVGLGNVDNTSDASKPVSTAQQTALDLKQNLLTNSAGLAAALSDETGSGAAVFATSPTLVTPTLGAASATSIDTGLLNPSGNLLELRNGTNIQSFRVYETYTNGANNAYFGINAEGTYFDVRTWKNGTGSNRDIRLMTSSGAELYIGGSILIKPPSGGDVHIGSNANLMFTSDNSKDIGASGATRPRTGYFGTSVVTPYLQMSEGSAPATPTNAIRLFADSSNRFSWKGENGFVRTFDGTANTADRVYTLPDTTGNVVVSSGTVAGIAGSGWTSGVTASTTWFTSPFHRSDGATTEVARSTIAPTAFTVKKLKVYIGGAQPASGSLTITLRVNGVDTTLQVVIPANAAAGSSHTDDVDAIAVAENDLISFSLVNAASATSATNGTISFVIQ